MSSIDRRQFIKTISGGVALWTLSRWLPGQEKQKHLNVLFIAVDDLNRRIGCYGFSDVKTPNIDRLAKKGVLFQRAYCQYPLCNPTRTSFLSGLYPETTGIMDNKTPPRTYLKDDVEFIPQLFKKNGYFTARVGKIFHGAFDDESCWSISEDAKSREDKDTKKKIKARGEQWLVTDGKDEDEPDGKTARRIVELLEQNKDKPFFISAGFHKPHLPWVAPKKYFDMYKPEDIKLPKEPEDDRDDIPEVALGKSGKSEEYCNEHRKEAIAAYYACISFMDAQLGVILDAMDKLNLWDNTIVVFWGDHGYHLGEHEGMWKKMSVFEESAGAPLIITAPQLKTSGQSCQRTVEFIDVYPTLVELCGLPQPKQKLEGKSLFSLLSNPNANWDKPAITVVQKGRVLGKSVRTEKFRYTEWDEGDEGVELYNHENDPNEYKNLADDPACSEVIKELKKHLKRTNK